MRFIQFVICAYVTLLATVPVFAQAYPTKPIRVVTSEPGGGGDLIARELAQGLPPTLGQRVIIDNRSGALPGEIVAKAQPDGYTLLLHGGSFWLAPLMQKLSYEVLRDFTPITLATRSPNVLVLHPAVAAATVKELIALARAKPGELNYASGASGVPTHLSAELFKSLAGVNIVRIPYKGTGPALTGVIAGEAHLIFATASAVSAHVKSGRLKALAVTSAEPTALMPGVPTVAATVPGYESVSIIGMFAPAKTPAAIVNMLNQESAKILTRADVRERFMNTGTETVGNTPQQFAAAVKTEIAKWGKVIKDAGVRAE